MSQSQKLWQLKRLSDGSALSDPQSLPENWGPVFGLAGVEERLGDLAWVGEEHVDTGWFVVGEIPMDPPSAEALAWSRAKGMLAQSDWSMLPDVQMTFEKKAEWIEYRRVLRDIRLQPGFPDVVQWPICPE